MEKKHTHYEANAKESQNQSNLSNAGDTSNTRDTKNTSNEQIDTHTLTTAQDDGDVMAQKSLSDNEIQQASTQAQTGKPSRRRKSTKQGRRGEDPNTTTSNEKSPADMPAPGEETPVLKDTLVLDQETTPASEDKKTSDDQDEEERFMLPEVLPILPLKDTVIYPFSVQPFAVGQERYIRLIDDVMHSSRRLVVLVAQKSADIDHPGPDDIYHMGTVSRIGRMFRMPDGTVQIAVQGLERVSINEFVQEKPYLIAKIEPKPDTQETGTEIEAVKRNVISYFQRLVALVQNVPEGVAAATLNLEEPRQVVYVIATFVQMDMDLRQRLLELDSVHEKLNQLSTFLAHELEILELGKKIQNSAQEEMSKMQREYMLREQLKAIQKELGEESEEQATIHDLRQKIDEARMPEEALKEANRELSRLEKLPTISPEYSIIRTYIELLVSLPWSKSTGSKIDTVHAREVLDQDHYDLAKIKERILEYLAVQHLKESRREEKIEQSRQEASLGDSIVVDPNQKTQPLSSPEATHTISREPILCFVGPPGVGKTSLGQSIARALGRKFARMSLGGIRDEAEVRGHRRTYIGAMPGRIIQTLRRVETNDPVIMLDEVDKVGADWRGDPSSALLEVLDPEQNYNFRDNYLDLPFDLSKVMFIATANALEPIPAPLRDRMEILELSGYTEEQKMHIARKYLLPKQLESNGLKEAELTVDDDALKRIARDYTREAGVRNLERQIGSLCRKVARQVSEGHETPIHISASQVPEYLGRQRFFEEFAERIDRPGIATGMVWTPVGGEIIFLEAATMAGKEERLILTGQLGDVMKESAMAALSYVRSNAVALGLSKNVFEGQNVHIHVPAGAIPKDGPSAGVTMATVLVSLATGKKVRSDVAMTGEITLRGKVMPIGGVKEKVLAAYRSGIRTVILPEKNRADLEEDLPKELRDEMRFVFASDIRQVLDAALEVSTSENEHATSNGQSRKRKSEKAEKAAKPEKIEQTVVTASS
jgi:ATP-dependent Lon protease